MAKAGICCVVIIGKTIAHYTYLCYALLILIMGLLRDKGNSSILILVFLRGSEVIECHCIK